MTKTLKLTWKDIIPPEQVAFAKRFISEYIDLVIDHNSHFVSETDRALLKDSGHLSWIHYYQEPPDILALIWKSISGQSELKLSSLPTERGRQFFELMHATIEKSKELTPGSEKEKELNSLIMPRLLPFKLSFVVVANHIACYTKYKATINDLIYDIREGNKGAVFTLLSVDHIFLELPEIQKQIREATLFNDEDFLFELGRTVELPSIRNELSNYRDDIFLLFAWNLGFEAVGLEQFSFFLQEIGFERFKDLSSLRKKLNRLGINIKKF